jgi:hypothetical protein
MPPQGFWYETCSKMQAQRLLAYPLPKNPCPPVQRTAIHLVYGFGMTHPHVTESGRRLCRVFWGLYSPPFRETAALCPTVAIYPNATVGPLRGVAAEGVSGFRDLSLGHQHPSPMHCNVA